jgi:hypothetical protein
MPTPVGPKKKLPLSLRFLIIAGAFFIVALLTAAYFLFVGGRTVSSSNIIISATGPTSVAGGDTVQLLITVENHNPVAITNVDLSASFPPDTRSGDDVTKAMTRYNETLDDIPAGQAVTRTVRFVLFGKENQTVTVPFTVDYKTQGSNSTFTAEKDYTVTLTTSPVSVTATAVSQISSGQQLTLNVLVRSNASKPLADVALKAEYPFGFVVSNTSVPSSNGLFNLGTLNPSDEQKVAITGTLTGENNDERVFKFTVGSTQNGTNGALAVSYADSEADVTITKPFLDVGVTLNGNSSDPTTVRAGDTVQGVLKWTNTLASNIQNAQIVVTLSGTGYDPASVTTQGGFYQSSNGTITFSPDTSQGLANLSPGDTGTGTFSFRMKTADQFSMTSNPSVGVSVSASGQRVSEAGVPQTLSSTVSRTVKVASGLGLSSSIVHTTGPFPNTGPWPPTSGTPTTYTVMLSASNGANPVGGAAATMTVPSYVTFTGQTNGGVIYNDATRTITWSIGDMSPNASKQTAFQISFLPSVSQKGQSPALVSPQTLTGTDRFTQTTINTSAPALSTQTKTDPAYAAFDGTVQ